MNTIQLTRSTGSRRVRRGAALYLTVLSTAMIVSLLGLTALTLVRIENQRVAVLADRRTARMNAYSAVELALQVCANDPDWRNTYANGVETTPQSLGPDSAGTISWILEDSDGSLTDADTDLRLKGVGRVGDSVQVSSVGLTYIINGLTCLDVAICGNGPMQFWSSSITTTDQIISSNSSIDTNSGTVVDSDVEAVGSITGGGYTGTTTTPVPARTMPSASAFDYYIGQGTAISFSAIPKLQGKATIDEAVLSPSNNPYGATNPLGIYVIDCGGNTIRIRDSRIIATLVLINPSSSSYVYSEVNWEPAIANYPALLVQGGSIGLETRAGPLDESEHGANFNPPGSPYQGITDNDQTDTYPSVIQGIVYATGDVVVWGYHPHFDGVLIAGDEIRVDSGKSLTVTYDPRYASDPPPGFLDPQSAPIKTSGSWIWDTAP